MIRKAAIKDVDSILEMTQQCAIYMIEKGILQWNEHYPNRKAFENDIVRGELYVLEHEKQIIGCIVISAFMDEEYMPINWLTSNDSNVYIHRLAVLPKFQGKGFAQKLMDFAEDWAKQHGFRSIRLDTFSQNHRNQTFYETRGYQRLGNIYFPKQSHFPFYCYELIL